MTTIEDFRFDRRRRMPIILGFVAVFIILYVVARSVIILQPTERGVVFKKFAGGLDVDDVKQEGLNFVAPWNDMITFSIEEQQIEETMDVLSKDGLAITIDVSLRFRPQPDRIGYLYRSFRTNYTSSFIRPELRSAVRRVIGQYTPEELYATKRQEIETRIENDTRETLAANNVELKALLFRSIQLPKTIQTSIEEKLAAEQEAQKYNYIIQREEKEAERRRHRRGRQGSRQPHPGRFPDGQDFARTRHLGHGRIGQVPQQQGHRDRLRRRRFAHHSGQQLMDASLEIQRLEPGFFLVDRAGLAARSCWTRGCSDRKSTLPVGSTSNGMFWTPLHQKRCRRTMPYW